jgi:hypothetical protein
MQMTDMVVVLKKGATKEEIAIISKRLEKFSNDGVDTRKYCGVIKLKEDPLMIQQKMRNEWQ